MSGQIKGLGLEHPFGVGIPVPNQITKERTLELTKLIRSDCATQAEKHELALGFMRLGLSIAARYSRRIPRKARDFVSCAMFGIVYAIDKAPQKLVDDNMAPWISANINRFCHRFMCSDHVIPISATSFIRKRKEGKPITPIKLTQISDEEYRNGLHGVQYHCDAVDKSQVTEEDAPRVKGRVYGVNHLAHNQQCLRHLQDIREDLGQIAQDNVDRQILQMREAGYKDREIADELHYSVAYINKRRQAMEERFIEIEMSDRE